MDRAALRVAVARTVGPLLREPIEAEWADLDARLTEITRRLMPATQRSLAELMATAPGRYEIARWARHHQLTDPQG